MPFDAVDAIEPNRLFSFVRKANRKTVAIRPRRGNELASRKGRQICPGTGIGLVRLLVIPPRQTEACVAGREANQQDDAAMEEVLGHGLGEYVGV